MRYLAPFAIFGTLGLERAQTAPHAAKYRRLLEALAADRFDLDGAAALDHVNAELDRLILPEARAPVPRPGAA